MNELVGIIRSFGVARLGAVIGVTLGVAITLGFIILRIGEPQLSMLYADLDYRAAQPIITQLEQDNVRHEVRERNGRVSIFAPREQTSRLKLAFAADGVSPASGVGYEIFDNNDAFGATSFQQNMNRLRALEGELGRTIATIAGVRSARVHLVLAERELFAREKKSASASIVVDAPTGLDQRAVKAIVNLTASAVPSLSPANVTILDASGSLYAAGDQAENPAAMGANAEEKTAATEARLKRTVRDIVGRIVGDENLRVQVSAEIDFNRVTENAEIIDPDSQTVLSSNVVEETSNDVDPARARGVSVGNALPGTSTVGDASQTATSASQRTEETTNYEISRTVRQEVREIGGIKRLSVAVALNAGETPRSEADLARITSLVRSAVGFDEARGDQVQVVEMTFAESDAPRLATAPTEHSRSISQEQMMRLAEVASLVMIGLALVYFVLRPMMTASDGAIAAPTPTGADIAIGAQDAPGCAACAIVH